jgi:NCS2 family nucleobase:cation symporter-2
VVATVTLLVTIALNVWGKGVARAACALVGIIVGYAVALPLGLVPHEQLAQLADLPPVQLPHVGYFAWSFDAVLIAPFLIAALANTLKAAALLTATEKLTDADWVRPNLKNIGGGVLADGITTAFSGAFCVFGVNISASSVGLSEASGVASRVVAYAIGGIFVVMAFIPDLVRFLTLMPAPVIGATFIFTSCAIIKGGIETIASRMLDARRTLVVGLALMTGLAVEAVPHWDATAGGAERRSGGAGRWCDQEFFGGAWRCLGRAARYHCAGQLFGAAARRGDRGQLRTDGADCALWQLQ